MLELKNLGIVFNPGTVNENRAMNKVCLTVEKGEFITIIGTNGAGKSTLFNLISGHFSPSEGQVLLHGKDVTREHEYKRAKKIGRIFQNPLLGTAGNMALEDNMVISMKKGFKGLRMSLSEKSRKQFRTHLVDLGMGLEDRLKDNVGLLSGGQRQALTLLMMAMSMPDLVLLDEHTAALDPKNAQVVMDLTLRYVREHKFTTLMITHNMQHAIEYGDRLLMLDKGEIILDLSGDEKQNLTVEKLVQRFHDIRKVDIGDDELLLS